MKKQIKVEIQATLSDRAGRVVKRYPCKPANSLLRRFLKMLQAHMSGVSQLMYDTGGVQRTVPGHATNFDVNAGVGVTTRGLVIGTGIDVVTMANQKLQTQVTTNVAHGATSFAFENPEGSTWRIAITRGFQNNTGALLTVKEVGLYCYGTASAYLFCIDRSLYNVEVANSLTLTLTYRLTITL